MAKNKRLPKDQPLHHASKELIAAIDFYENKHVTRHILQFCEFLYAVARRAAEQKKYSGSREEFVLSAMRFHIDGGLPKKSIDADLLSAGCAGLLSAGHLQG